MTFFLERFFSISRARWWQVFASVVIGAVFGAQVVFNEKSLTYKQATVYTLCGGLLGLVGAMLLIWVDAGRACREQRGDFRLTFRERMLACCVIGGCGLGLFSMTCGVLMGCVRMVEFVRSM